MKNQNCPQCGNPVADELPGGLCPTCLMVAARQSQEEVDRTHAMSEGFRTPSISEMARLFPELEIIQFVGRGGMGAVYKVRQKNLDRVVALKVFLHRDDDPEFAARFQREARALARLNHPNIVTVHDFGVRENAHYLIMEFIDGLNLRQLCAEERLSPDMALQMVPQLCDALQYAHDNGVIHRDIKPENLLLDTNGRINIADFGLAKMTGPDNNGTLTRTQQVMGTLNYMAPEQRERPTEVDHRADIYSLGVVIYEMLTGELPLGRFQPPSSKSDVNAKLDEVVMRALEKEPDRRYQQASEFKSGFESVGGFTPVHAPSPPIKQFGVDQPFRRPNGTRCLLSFMSGREKKGNWTPGDPQMGISVMAAICLDLTEVAATEVNLTLFTLMGAVEVIVPHGATVDLDGFILMGATVDKVVRGSEPCNMHVRIHSWGAMGACEVRTPTVKETRTTNKIKKQLRREAEAEQRSLRREAEFEKKNIFRETPDHNVTFRGGLVFLYQMFAMLVTLTIPVWFLCGSFDILDDEFAKVGGIVTAILTGLVWAGTDYFRILVGAGPKETDEASLHAYYSATKVGTLVRCVGLMFAFACPILFVFAAFDVFGDEKVVRFAAIVCGIICAVVFSCADQVEEFFYGKLKE